ncbi:hypothetical protein HU200_010403 [Digitaria exilis]|uniref:Uncharacterized protein n=1 Tax=Digitaria exilis TaxID=1010633 RepID=A0A835FII4_9POAL|nr:hypothetical protein HU200_010403 [Digitaria exilis]
MPIDTVVTPPASGSTYPISKHKPQVWLGHRVKGGGARGRIPGAARCDSWAVHGCGRVQPDAPAAARGCVSMLGDGEDLLQQAVDAMARLGKQAEGAGRRRREQQQQPGSETWASAALRNGDMCVRGGAQGGGCGRRRRRRADVAGVSCLTANALGIVNAAIAKQMPSRVRSRKPAPCRPCPAAVAAPCAGQQRSDVSRIMAHAALQLAARSRHDHAPRPSSSDRRSVAASRSVKSSPKLHLCAPGTHEPLLHFALLRSQARGGHSPSSGVSVTLKAPQASSRGAFTLERRFRHPRGSAAKLEGGIHPRAAFPSPSRLRSQARGGHSPSSGVSVTLEAPQPSSRGAFTLELGKLELAIQARSVWSKRLVQARKLCPTSTFNLTRFEVQFKFLEIEPCQSVDLCTAHGALTGSQRRARAACRRPASTAPTDSTAVCPRSRCMQAPCSADPRRALELSPRRRHGPPGKSAAVVIHRSAVQMSRPRVPFSPLPCPLSSPTRACRPRLRRADAAHGANTAATSRCRRDSSPSCPNLPLPSPLKLRAIPFLSSASSALAPAKLTPPGAQPCPTDAHRAIPLLPPPPQPPAFPPPPAHVHSSLHSSSGRTEGTNSFPVPRWCSPTLPRALRPRRRRSTLAGASRAATAVADRDSGHPRPRDLAQTNHGEPLSISPTSPARSRRRLAGVTTPANSRTRLCLQPLSRGLHSGLADGVYELVLAAEEIAQESEVNLVHVDPSPEQECRFEPEGKPRSIT